MILLLLLFIRFINLSPEKYIEKELKHYIELERMQMPSGIILIMKDDDDFYLIYLKKNSLKWYTSSISMLSKNDTSRLHTSYIYNEFDGIGFLWGVKETQYLKSVKVYLKTQKL